MTFDDKFMGVKGTTKNFQRKRAKRKYGLLFFFFFSTQKKKTEIYIRNIFYCKLQYIKTKIM